MLSNLIRNVLSGTISGVINGSGGAPPINERYFTQLDGQSKYWRRIEPNYGQTTNATLECLFYGGGIGGLELLVGRQSGNNFYLALSSGEVVFGNGGSGSLNSTPIDSDKINHAKLIADGTSITFFVNGVQIAQVSQSWLGLLDSIGFGARGDNNQNPYSGILVSARVSTDTVDNVYGLDTNLPYDLADGTTDPLADSTLIFENGSVDGSDRLLVTQTDTGFIGEDGTVYDYAEGAAPSPINQRYFTQLDGQSKYWRRINPDYGQTTSTVLECLFYGGSAPGLIMGNVFDRNGQPNGGRFYLSLKSAGVLEVGNGSQFGNVATVDPYKINHFKMASGGGLVTVHLNGVLVYSSPQYWDGDLQDMGIGAIPGSTQPSFFYGGIVIYARVTTDTRDDIYGLDTNLPYDLADGTTDPLADSTLIFENGSIDQSDRLLVTENAEVGFLGDDKWFDAIKAVTGQATVPTDDSITIDEVGGTLAGVAINFPVGPITVTGDCDLISGQVDISVVPALAGVAASITQSGSFSFDLDSQGALGFKRAFSGGAQAVITNIKVKLRYDYAAGANPDAGTYSSEYSNEYS